MKSIRVVLIQLGSPESPEVPKVRAYLREFLSDPRVIDRYRKIWKLILNLFILPFRPKESAKAYRRIWDGVSFPLLKHTEAFTRKVQSYVHPSIAVEHCFLLSKPRLEETLNRLLLENKKAEKLLFVPLFPQYSEATTASAVDAIFRALKNQVLIPDFEVITHFYNSKAFITSAAEKIQESLRKMESAGIALDRLILSFHGMPKRRIFEKKDPYYDQCLETARLLIERLPKFDSSKISVTFQSHFGNEAWLEPSTEEFLMRCIAEGAKNFAIFSPSFVADCLETNDALGFVLKNQAMGAEHFTLIPSLNDDESWARAFAQWIETHAIGNLQDQEALVLPKSKQEIVVPVQTIASTTMSVESKSTLRIVLFSLLLDLIGFSILFPLFPALMKHYLSLNPNDPFLQGIFTCIQSFSSRSGVSDFSTLALFGGILGSVYSFFQFLAAPFWGSLSDRIGRRPVLIFTVFGLTFSYLLWGFAGSFTVLVLSRILGGIMGGNLSTITATVADITTKTTRSKGMAMVGMTFGLGFVLGPALGGLLSSIDLTKYFPGLVRFGLNPFSMVAFCAFILSLYNFFRLYRKFPETFPKEKRKAVPSKEILQSLFPLRSFPFPGVNRTNGSYLTFLAIFSGMEFTLTFLAFERLNYSSVNNAWIFIYAGFLIALTQGVLVRPYAHSIGEKKLSIAGILLLIPGFMLLGATNSNGVLYLGLTLISIGSALSMSCLTSLVSLLTPPERQGEVIGVFRSMGSMARVIGPFLACLTYWKFGSYSLYIFGSLLLLFPVFLLSPIKQSRH